MIINLQRCVGKTADGEECASESELKEYLDQNEFNLHFVSKKIEPDMFSDSPKVSDKDNYFPI